MKTDPKNTSHPLILQIEKLFNKELAAVNDYLLHENRIFRRKFGNRVPLTEADRRILVKYGMRIKDRLADVVSIVKPETILAWNRRMKQRKWTYDNTPKKPGRPPRGKETEELVVRLGEENVWGYKSIAGEMKKLGHDVSKTYVRNVLRKHGIPPAPDRRGMSWKQFIQAHVEVTWAADLFTEEVWTLGGLVTFYVLFFIHLGTRRVHVAGCTPHPDSAWMAQQARNFCIVLDESSQQCRYLIHDRDSCFIPFDGIMKSEEDIDVVKTPPQAPRCNAFAERHIREARETLDSMVLLGERHLHHVLKRIESHHNGFRPHQGLGNVIPLEYEYPTGPFPPDRVKCASQLGGLLNHYYGQKAA